MAENEREPDAPLGVCRARHPLLLDVWCERERSHDGQHRAIIRVESYGAVLHWDDGWTVRAAASE